MILKNELRVPFLLQKNSSLAAAMNRVTLNSLTLRSLQWSLTSFLIGWLKFDMILIELVFIFDGSHFRKVGLGPQWRATLRVSLHKTLQGLNLWSSYRNNLTQGKIEPFQLITWCFGIAKILSLSLFSRNRGENLWYLQLFTLLEMFQDLGWNSRRFEVLEGRENAEFPLTNYYVVISSTERHGSFIYILLREQSKQM